MMSLGPNRRPGRPRDASIDQQAIAATLDLLAEVGFEGTTVQAIAARSGLHASALYRRWSSRIAVIEDAVSPMLAATSFTPSGDLGRDLRRFVRAYASTWGSRAARAAIPGLLAHYQATGTSRSAEGWLQISVRPQFLDILRAAPAGSVDPDVDPEDVFDVLLGAILARTLVPVVVERQRPLERTVELVLKMLQPPTRARGDLGHGVVTVDRAATSG
jgi:AcrR family transcriptional regulator